jgi:hypothetical protein
MRKGIWEMLGETLREASLVVVGVGFLERLFSDGSISAEDAVLVLCVSALIWLSGAWMEETREE